MKKRTGITLVAMVLIALASAGSTVIQLAWDPPVPSDNVVGYRLHYGAASRTNSGGYDASIDMGNVLQGSVPGLSPTTTHYFAVTAISASSNESPYSAEVVWDNDPPAISLSTNRVTLRPNADGTAPLFDCLPLATISDNCTKDADLLTGQVPPQGTPVPIGKLRVAVWAEDEAGNHAEAFVTTIVRKSPGITDTPPAPTGSFFKIL